MKYLLNLLAIAVLIPAAALAQSTLDDEVNAELDKMYQAQPAQTPQVQRSAGPAVQVNVQAQPAVTANQANNQGTMQATNAQAAAAPAPVIEAQKQPTTTIQASPLVESKAEKIRKDRQDAEVQTEQKIVEKLEESRLTDEKKRADVLFGDKFNALSNQNSATPTPPVAPVVPTPVPVVQQPQVPVVPVVPVVQEQTVQPAPVVERDEVTDKSDDSGDKLDREAIRGEVTAALAEFKKEDPKPKTSSYISLLAGSGDYPDAVNVKGQYSLGVAFGRKFNDRLIAEGSFLFSNFQVEQPAGYGNGATMYNYQTGTYDYYPRITDMNQYSTSALVKYQLLGGTFRPEVGTLMSYTYRTFSDKQFAITDATLSSQALDIGLMAGASVELSESFALGLEYRYMWNMTNKLDGTTLQKSSLYGNNSNYTPIEQLSYRNISVVGRATF